MAKAERVSNAITHGCDGRSPKQNLTEPKQHTDESSDRTRNDGAPSEVAATSADWRRAEIAAVCPTAVRKNHLQSPAVFFTSAAYRIDVGDGQRLGFSRALEARKASDHGHSVRMDQDASGGKEDAATRLPFVTLTQ